MKKSKKTLSIEKERKIFEEELVKSGEERHIERAKILDAERAVNEHNKLVIVGIPGSGKTTLLKHLALKSCQENLQKQERICVPIPITLRKFLESKKSLREYVDEIFDNYGFSKAREFIEKDMKEGKTRVLADGFDELATKENQDRVTEEIQRFVEKYPKSQFIVTSRSAGYHDELKGFAKLELMEFDDKQIEKFIGNWFGKDQPEKANLMSNAIMKNRQIKSLARNPLMVAIIATVYEEGRELPQKRAALYERCIQVLLSKWDAQKRLRNKYTPEKKEFVLRKLAFYGHSNNKRVMSEKEVMAEMLGYFPQIQLRNEDARSFLDEIWQRSYLLKQISMDTYDFLHLSFQEYFTALELKEQQDGISTIIKHLDEPWWEEPTLLYAGISKDATALIKRIRKEVPEDIFYSNLMLFGKCVADADFTEVSLRDEIINNIWALYQTSDFEPLSIKVIEVLALIKPDSIIGNLIKDLSHKVLRVRWRATYALGVIGSEKAIEPLIKVLTTDKERNIPEKAAKALGVIGNDKAIEPLIKVLTTDKEGDVRENAAYALGVIGNEKAIEPLIKALTTDKERGVRENAAYALGVIGNEKAIEPLIKALTTDKEGDIQVSVAYALEEIGNEKAIEPLIKVLTTDKEGDVRKRAAYALGVLGGKKAIEPLIKVLTTDKERDVRGSAASALGVIGNEKAIEPLIKALTTDIERDVRWRVADALGKIGNEKAIESLIKALTTDKEDGVRENAAYALGDIGSEKAIEPLIKALTTDKEVRVRWRAADALGEIGNEKATEPLIKALTTDKEVLVRRRAAYALGDIGSEKAIEPLIKALTTDKEGDVRGSAASALGKIGSEKAIEPLIKALITDKEGFVRGRAADALGKIGNEKAIEILKIALKDESLALGGRVKDNAFSSLERISRRTNRRITSG